MNATKTLQEIRRDADKLRKEADRENSVSKYELAAALYDEIGECQKAEQCRLDADRLTI